MTMHSAIMLETDYLVIGAGVSGMGFVDELFRLSQEVNVIIVDKHSSPGGHWNDAYSFVTLHQPAHLNGLNSKKLGRNEKDLATRSEILVYYETAMKEFLASGRVKFFPQCEYTGDGEFRSLLVPNMKYKVGVMRKIVNATYVGPTIPSTNAPDFGIATGVNFIPINGLSTNKKPWERYFVIGGGKTGIDAVLFLLNQSVNPDNITWIIPNDYWFLIRDRLYPSEISTTVKLVYGAIIKSQNANELYKYGEEVGYFGRLDQTIKPTRMKSGTVSMEELIQLRLVKNIVRKGRVKRIGLTQIVFENDDSLEIDEDTLNVNCTACGLPPYPPRKIFDGNTITIQEITLTQISFSACAIAAYESYFPFDEEKKNAELKPVPHPVFPEDFIEGLCLERKNVDALNKSLGLRWTLSCRLVRLNHVSYLDLAKVMVWLISSHKQIGEAMDRLKKKDDNEDSQPE